MCTNNISKFNNICAPTFHQSNHVQPTPFNVALLYLLILMEFMHLIYWCLTSYKCHLIGIHNLHSGSIKKSSLPGLKKIIISKKLTTSLGDASGDGNFREDLDRTWKPHALFFFFKLRQLLLVFQAESCENNCTYFFVANLSNLLFIAFFQVYIWKWMDMLHAGGQSEGGESSTYCLTLPGLSKAYKGCKNLKAIAMGPS